MKDSALSRKIKVFDHRASRVVFETTRSRAMDLVDANVLFVLSADPLEVAFRFGVSIDQSNILGPKAAVRAAFGSKRVRELLESRRTIQMRSKLNPENKDEIAKTRSFSISQDGVPHELTMQTAERSILYFPNEGRRNAPPTQLVRRTSEGWELREASGWTLITEREAKELLETGSAKLPVEGMV